MAVDYVGRQLYYSNIGSVSIEGRTYSWHKVETANIDSYEPKVKTIISSIADKPRAIAVDVENWLDFKAYWVLFPAIINWRNCADVTKMEPVLSQQLKSNSHIPCRAQFYSNPLSIDVLSVLN